MVDAQSGHVASRKQLENELMSRFEHLRNFHSDCGEVVDVEEAPIVDFLGGGTPIAKPIYLSVEQIVQSVEARRISGIAFERTHARDR